MTKRPTGLAAFTGKGTTAPSPEPTPAPSIKTEPAAVDRKRGKGETVALTVRVTRADWMRLHQLALAEGVSLQALAMSGLSKIFAEHGLPPITS